jgi:reductive dehalogenase
MDYHCMAAAPSWMQDATAGDAYAHAIKTAGQLTIFLRQLGYQAVASMNDLGINAPYAIAAGLGEGARNGQIITPTQGPRIRISKVYTDFEPVEYDKPRTFGVASFCLNCKRCADSCPSKAITFGDQSWEPTYSSDPDYIWHASRGVLKFHNDAKKCAKFWIDNDGSCGNCIASCPYNKPDFWHHRLVDAQNVLAPGPVHAFMREMDIFFGYGKVTWYILGVLTGAVAYSLYLTSKKITLNWLSWSGLIAGSSLILFSIAWAVGSVLEGVPRAASMGILLFGLSGVVILTLTARMITSNKA